MSWQGHPPLSLPPIKPFGEHAYTQAALHGAVAAMAACYGAADSGVGEHLDLSVQEVGVFFIGGRTFATYTYGGVAQSRNSPTPYEPQSLYPCQDGYIYLICAEQSQWERLVEVMGKPSWAQAERFATRDQRGKNGDELKACISAWTAQHTVAELFHACQQARVGAAPVLTPAQLEHDAHLQARAYFTRQSQAQAGTLPMPGPPIASSNPGGPCAHPHRCWARPTMSSPACLPTARQRQRLRATMQAPGARSHLFPWQACGYWI